MRSSPLVLGSCLASFACSTTPGAPPPSAPDSAGVAIALDVRAPVRIFSSRQDDVMFVRLPDGDASDLVHGTICPSNWTMDGYCCLLNAQPGTYVAVACHRAKEPPPSASGAWPEGCKHFTTYLSEEMVRGTEVSVAPGQIVFMGSFVVDQSISFEGADGVQLHYYGELAPGYASVPGFLEFLSGDYHYRGMLHSADRSAAASETFRKASRGPLAEAGWPQSAH